MFIKNKKIILPSVILLVALITFAYFLQKGVENKLLVRVLDNGPSICTQDIARSSCGSYEVTVQLSDGRKTLYTVVGFENRDSERYDEITSKLDEAKKRATEVEIRINNSEQITSVR